MGADTHIHTPAAPRVACCGDKAATKFTPWRWKATCAACKLITQARPLDGTREQQVTYRTDLPVRFSTLIALVRANAAPNVEEAIAEFERDRKTAAHCTMHGALADPIALLDMSNNRMVFVCPDCTKDSHPDLYRRWRA
jgi:hypothetical protein